MKTIKILVTDLILMAAILTMFAMTANAQQTEVMTNASIVQLYQKGLSASILVNKIQTSKGNYDVSVDALIKLKEQKIPDDVVNAMIKESGNSPVAVNSDPNDPLSAHESGVYLELKASSHKELKELEPSVCSQSSTNAAARMLVSGLINSKEKASLADNAAHTQTDDGRPVFYFYFEKSNGNSLNGSNNWYFQNATNPNEFMLIKMDVKSRTREFVTGTQNNLSSKSGIAEKYIVSFDHEKIAPGIYKVTPKEKLEPGEYCWMYAGNTPRNQGQKVYDFGVKENSVVIK